MTSLDDCMTLDILDDSTRQSINFAEPRADCAWHSNADTS